MNNSKTALVSTQELAEHLGAWRIFDCRHNIMDPGWGARQYAISHIEGAIFARMENDLSGPKSNMTGRHPLPARDQFLAWLGQHGITSGDQIVCYDDGPGANASRMWWLLRWVGHQATAVLEGGFGKWSAEQRPVTTRVPVFSQTTFSGGPPLDEIVTVDQVSDRLSALTLIDARAPRRYAGEDEPVDKEAGHIPGARNRFNMDNVEPDGMFKSKDEIKRAFDSVLQGTPPDQAVHYCGSGVSACHNLLAMHWAGLAIGKLYVGSWSEWIVDPARPRARTKP